MNSRAHAVLARSAGFCFGVAGFILSIFSAILSAVVIDTKSSSQGIPLGRPRRRRPVPVITMTRVDDGDMDPGSLSALSLSFVDEASSRPLLHRSASSPELTMIPATSFLRPPTPERRRKRLVLRKKPIPG